MRMCARLYLLAALAFGSLSANAADRVTYFVPDALGSPVAAMDEQGNVLWRETYAPYGERKTKAPDNNAKPAYTGKPEDADTGLVYMGARMYDPETARFTGIDSQGFKEGNAQTFGRYVYANNSPYVYNDPNGESGLLTGLLVWMGIGATAGATTDAFFQYSITGHVDGAQVAGAALDGMVLGPLAITMASRASGGIAAEESMTNAAAVETGTETVQRWMSKIELEATRNSGLIRGGKEGTHFVTDAANSDPLRARQRLALPKTPEVRATLEVPKGAFSQPSKVEPAFNMPGGGTERTATGKIPAKVLRVD